ncbi:MAG: pitrilysin family protein [Myxococcota bacterium]
MSRGRARGHWLALWAGLVLWLGATAAQAASVLDHERYSMDNGLDVVLHVDRRLPLVAVSLAYHVGAMHDGSRPGLAHVVEHLMFRGTRKVPDGEFNYRLVEAGAQHTNAITHYDQTVYHTVIPADRLDEVLWLESDRMAHLGAALTDETFGSEIETTIDEWENRIRSERNAESFMTMWEVLFPEGHPFQHARPDVIARLNTDDGRGFVRRHYGPANATLVLAGDLPDDVGERLERYFGPRSGGTRPSRPSLEAAAVTRDLRIARAATLSTVPLVLVGWPSPGLYDEGDAAADVLAFTLNAGRLARLIEAQSPGVVLEVEARQLSRSDQSVFFFAAYGAAHQPPEPVLEALDAALAELRQHPLNADDVRRARRRLGIDTLRGLQRLDQRAAQIQSYISAGKAPDWIDEDLARYAAVDEVAVAAFVREHLPPDRRVAVLTSPVEGGR